MNKMYAKLIRKKALAFLISSVVIVFMVASIVELPLPPEEEGEKTVTGKLLRCDLVSLTKRGKLLKIRIKARDGTEIDLKMKIANSIHNQEFYPELCENSSVVKVWYKAERTILRPEITYKLHEIVDRTNAWSD